MSDGIPVVGAPPNARYSRPDSAANAGGSPKRQTATSVVRRAGVDIRVDQNDVQRNVRAIQRQAQVEPERTLAAVTRNLSRSALGLLQ